MDTRLQVIAIVVSAGLFLLVFELVRRRRLLERYALLWLFASAVLLGLSVWTGALDQLARAMGVAYGPSVLFAVALGFVFILMLHFSLVISRLSDQNKVLAQHLAILQRRLEAMAEHADDAEVDEAAAVHVEDRFGDAQDASTLAPTRAKR